MIKALSTPHSWAEYDSFSRSFAETVSSLLRKSGIYLIFEVLVLNMKSNRIIKNLRNTINRSGQEYDCERLSEVHRFSERVRNSYVDLLESITIAKYPKFLIAHTENAVGEWDDLVEDTLIGSDPEFRELIYEIARMM